MNRWDRPVSYDAALAIVAGVVGFFAGIGFLAVVRALS